MFCPCGRSHKNWLEEQELVDFIKNDMRKRQLCCVNIFSSGEDLFQHVVHAKGYGSMVYYVLPVNTI